VPAYLPFVQPKLTSRAVEAAERKLGVRLPTIYLALLRKQNGGYLRGGSSRMVWGIGPRFPSITRDRAWWHPERADEGAWAPKDPLLLVPFDGDGHTNFCFDYRSVGPRGEPSIAWIDCECENEVPIAANFEAYLAELTVAPGNEVHAYGIPVDPLVRRLAKHWKVRPHKRGAATYGYEEYFVRLPDSEDDVVCSANRVAAGFDRKGSKAVLTEKTALRVPEDRRCTVLLGCRDEARERLLAALSDLGIEAAFVR